MNLKNKLSKQAEQKQNHRYGDHLEGYQLGGERGAGGEGGGIKKYTLVQNRQGDDKNSIGNGVAKELICMTCGHELRGYCQREWEAPAGGGQKKIIGTTVIA